MANPSDFDSEAARSKHARGSPPFCWTSTTTSLCKHFDRAGPFPFFGGRFPNSHTTATFLYAPMPSRTTQPTLVCVVPQCGYSTRKYCHMKAHFLARHTSVRLFQCHAPQCTAAFVQNSNLRSHFRRVHQPHLLRVPHKHPWWNMAIPITLEETLVRDADQFVWQPRPVPRPAPRPVPPLPIPSHLSPTSPSLLYAHPYPHPIFVRPDVCPHAGCYVAFTTRRHWMQHMKDVHAETHVFVCPAPWCARQYRCVNGLCNHFIMQHTDERPWRCPMASCNYSTGVRERLQKHLQQYHRARPTLPRSRQRRLCPTPDPVPSSPSRGGGAWHTRKRDALEVQEERGLGPSAPKRLRVAI